jgi:hypothetical protein
LGSPETKMATGGWPDLPPLAVGVDRGHPQWPDLSLFFFFGSLESRRRWRWAVASVRRRWWWVTVGGGIWSVRWLLS